MLRIESRVRMLLLFVSVWRDPSLCWGMKTAECSSGVHHISHMTNLVEGSFENEDGPINLV
jgi:hypothetical protein